MELFRECIKYNGMNGYQVKKTFRMSVRKFTDVANILPKGSYKPGYSGKVKCVQIYD